MTSRKIIGGAIQPVTLFGCDCETPLATSPLITQDYLYDIAAGKVSTKQPILKIGYNSDVDNALETIWTGGTLYAFPSGAMRMEVNSANAADTAAGAGVQQVRIGYLDSSYTAQIEIVTLNGGTVATTATNIIRVNSFRAVRVGANKISSGIINLRHLADTPVYSQIALGQVRARNSVYTVPAGKTLHISSVGISAATGTSAPQYCIVTLYASYDDVGGPLNFMMPRVEFAIQEQAIIRHFELPLNFPQATDIYFAAIGEGGTSSLIVSTAMRGWLEDA